MDRDEAKRRTDAEQGEGAQTPDLEALQPTILDAISAARALTRTLKHLPDNLPEDTATHRRLHRALDRLTVECDRVIGVRVYGSEEGAPDAE